MTAVLPVSRGKQFSSGALCCPTAQRYFLDDSGVVSKSPMHDDCAARDCPSPVASTLSSIPPSPNFPPAAHDQFSYTPTTLSSLSLEDEEIVLPSYDADEPPKTPEGVLPDTPAELPTESTPRTPSTPAADDTSVEEEPSRHVDYLSHEWREEDIWASWRYVTARKNIYSNGVRLENASWRTWAKAKHNLGTISPETLNWLKDCDVTWLYGPLKTSGDSVTASDDASPPPSRLETPSSYLDRKPILKKKTASETILQRSLSQHTLLQHAGAILKAQEAAENGRTRPPLGRAHTDISHFHHRTGSSSYSLGGTLTTTSSSSLASPSERRHIHFNDEVVQCIAVEAKEGDEEEEEEEVVDEWPAAFEDESSSDDGVVMMPQPPSRASISNRSTPRSSFSGEGKTIAPLPPTTLKYRGDTPEPPAATSILGRWSAFRSTSTPSPTSSVETLRPSQPSANFLLDDEDDGLDFSTQFGSTPGYRSWYLPQRGDEDDEDDEDEEDRRLRLTTSGMFMPFEEGEPGSASILGRVVDTVNTARDIAHVIWNVGWRR